MFEILEKCCTPKRGTKYSAYVDLFARENVDIGAGETNVVKLGVKLDLDKLYKSWYFYTEQNNISGSWDMYLSSHYLEVALRSSLAVKGLIIANGTGKVDLDYPNEIGLIVHNPYNVTEREIITQGRLCREVDIIEELKEPFKIKKGDKVAQCTIAPHEGFLMGYETETLRAGGFGSTGI